MKLQTMNDTEIKLAMIADVFTSWNGRSFGANEAIGGVTGNGTALKVQALKVRLNMEQKLIVENGEEFDPRMDAWEGEWLANYQDRPIAGVDLLRWNLKAVRSDEDAVEESIGGDVQLFIIGYIIVVVYLMVQLGGFNVLTMRPSIGLAAFVGVGLTIAATFGMCSAFGLFYGPVHSVLPLLLLGIGADDAFVITASFDHIDPNRPIRERIALSLSKAGAAVTVTSLTNSCAFFIGSITVFPALRSFALWAAIGVMMDFVLQSTFYVACLTLDARRQAARKMDMLCCVSAGSPNKECCGSSEPGSLRRFFKNKFSRVILNKWVQVVIMLLTVGMFAACVYGTSELKLESSRSQFYLDGSSILNFEEAKDQFFPGSGTPVAVYAGAIAYETTDVQRKLYQLSTSVENGGAVASNQYVQKMSVDCWLLSMRESYNLDVASRNPGDFFSASEFYPKLNDFLNSTAGSRYRRDLTFDADGRLNATRFSALFFTLTDNSDQIDAMKTLRDDVEAVGLEGAFPFAFEFLIYEQFAVLYSEAVQGVLLSLCVVLVVSQLLIGHPGASLVAFLGVGLTIVDILGLVTFWDINLNGVSVICLSVAIGLSIDFSAHIALAFMEAAGTRHQRVESALAELGPSLVHGGLSTFLAVSVLIAARGYVFRVFFRMFFLIIGFGMFHGLVVVPIILSLVGPAGFYASQEEKEQEEQELEAAIIGGPRVHPDPTSTNDKVPSPISVIAEGTGALSVVDIESPQHVEGASS
eukprot:NODE_262_length_2571_cov_16.693894_g240_i0.p1 GENE.NODE_262_length_2571_cov_16.693894_g240_i0~~NODE_262_length_2571_cov_16.693894_g240_i0.p1  ORF type:complete len:822 (+),score=177.04 NODE_262_length_2571_cov_16.693894_g240_i0:206-2467(+)